MGLRAVFAARPRVLKPSLSSLGNFRFLEFYDILVLQFEASHADVKIHWGSFGIQFELLRYATPRIRWNHERACGILFWPAESAAGESC